jgi:hypothetical protein
MHAIAHDSPREESPRTSGADPRGFMSCRNRSQLWIWSKIRCADASLMEWPGSVRMISVIRRPFRSAISVHLLSGRYGGRLAR